MGKINHIIKRIKHALLEIRREKDTLVVVID